MKSIIRPATSAILVVALTCSIGACSVVSAISPRAYLDNVGVKNVNLAALPPGIYTGDYSLALPPDVYAMNRHFSVTVTITAASDVVVTITTPTSLKAAGAAATQDLNDKFKAMIARIETAKAIPVDGVSGASCSSKAFLKAVEKAVAP